MDSGYLAGVPQVDVAFRALQLLVCRAPKPQARSPKVRVLDGFGPWEAWRTSFVGAVGFRGAAYGALEESREGFRRTTEEPSWGTL